MNNRIRVFLKMALTLALFLFLGYQVDLPALFSTLVSARPLLVLVATLVHIASVFLSVLRWKVILSNFDIITRYHVLARITFIGFFFNLFLPSGIGGDFYRAYYLAKREGRGMSTTIATTFLERGAGLCALLFLGTSFAAVRRIEVEGIPLILVFLPLTGLFLVSNLVLFHRGIHGVLDRLLRRRRWNTAAEKLDLVCRGLDRLRGSGRSISVALLVSLLVQFLSVVTVWITAQAIAIDVPFVAFLIFVPLINLTIMVPLTINGLGLREVLFFLLFSQIGFPGQSSVGLSLLTFCVYVLTAIPGAFLYSFFKRADPTLPVPEGR